MPRKKQRSSQRGGCAARDTAVVCSYRDWGLHLLGRRKGRRGQCSRRYLYDGSCALSQAGTSGRSPVRRGSSRKLHHIDLAQFCIRKSKIGATLDTGGRHRRFLRASSLQACAQATASSTSSRKTCSTGSLASRPR